jgi:O-antigen/teichoic acid export membrane protein
MNMADPPSTGGGRIGWPRGSLVGSVASGLGSQSALVISGVLAARMLGVENRGYLALLMLVPFIVAQLAGLGLPIGLTYFVAGARSTARAVMRSLAPVILAQAAIVPAVHLAALVLLLEDAPGAVWTAALATLPLGPASLAHQYALGLLQGQQRFRALNLVRLLPASLYAAGVAALYLAGEDRLLPVALAWTGAIVGAAACSTAVAAATLRRGAGGGSPPSRASLVRFGLKGLLGSSAPSETFRLDQAVVALFLSPAALGLYVVGLAFTNLPRFLSQSIGMIAYPRVAADADVPEARRAAWRFVALTAAVCLPVIVALELTLPALMRFFFGAEFTDAVPLARLLLVAAFFWSLRRTLSDGARGVGLPTLGSVGELVAWVVLPIGLAVLVPLGGVLGVSLAMVIAAFASFAVVAVGFALSATRPWAGAPAVPGGLR